MTISPADLDAVTFSMDTRNGAGYDPAAVDDFLDRVRERLVEGRTAEDLVAEVRFPISRAAGYHAGEVDDFLDRLAPGASMTASGPVSPSVIKPLPEDPGFFGRLFGRR